MAEYYESHALKSIATAVNKLIFDLRTNMTSVSRYVRDNREKHPTLTEGQFVDRNLEYKRLAEQAVDNILHCLDSNEYLRNVEGLETLVRQTKPTATTGDAAPVVHGRWLLEREPDGTPYCLHCSACDGDLSRISITTAYPYCPNCGAKMDVSTVHEQAD